MPGLVAENVIVAGAGNVYVSPEGTAMPEPAELLTAPAEPWIDLGYCDNTGVVLSFGRTVNNLDVWQSVDPIRVLKTAEPKLVRFTLMQFEPETVARALGGGTVTVDPGPPPVAVYTPAPASALEVRAVLIDFADGDKHYRWGFYRMMLNAAVEIPLSREGAAHLPIEYAVLAQDPSAYLMHSDDPAWTGNGSAIVATGATAGTPGSFTPAGATAPANLAAMAGIVASPAAAWAAGEYVVLGDSSEAYWDGAAWAVGQAP